MPTGVWWEEVKKGHPEYLDTDWKINYNIPQRN
jgi:hypothetical protein